MSLLTCIKYLECKIHEIIFVTISSKSESYFTLADDRQKTVISQMASGIPDSYTATLKSIWRTKIITKEDQNSKSLVTNLLILRHKKGKIWYARSTG